MSSQIWRLGRKCFARTMLYVHVYKHVFGDRHLGTLNRTYIDLSSLLTRPVDRPPVLSSMLAAFSKLRTKSTRFYHPCNTYSALACIITNSIHSCPRSICHLRRAGSLSSSSAGKASKDSLQVRATEHWTAAP